MAASADDAHSRFQAITAAYDALRGKTALSNGPTSAGAQEARYQTTAAYRAMQRRRQNLYDRGTVDDSKLDKWLIAGVVGVRLLPSFEINISPYHPDCLVCSREYGHHTT